MAYKVQIQPNPFYRIQWFCPVCDKSHETVGHFPKPRIHCGDCLMKYHQIVEMVFESAQQLPDEPMVNIKVVGPDGETIEGDEDEMVDLVIKSIEERKKPT